MIEYDDHEYLFEGFSLFSHTPLTNVSLRWIVNGIEDKPWILHHTVFDSVCHRTVIFPCYACFSYLMSSLLFIPSEFAVPFILCFRGQVSRWVFLTILFERVNLNLTKVKQKSSQGCLQLPCKFTKLAEESFHTQIHMRVTQKQAMYSTHFTNFATNDLKTKSSSEICIIK